MINIHKGNETTLTEEQKLTFLERFPAAVNKQSNAQTYCFSSLNFVNFENYSRII